MLLVVLALAGVLPVTELLPELKFGGISSESLDECIGGGLERELLRRLELDDSADRPQVAPLAGAACVLCSCADEQGTLEYNADVVDVEGRCDDEWFVAKVLDETCVAGVVTVAVDDGCCCWFCSRYCCRNWIANRGKGKLIGSWLYERLVGIRLGSLGGRFSGRSSQRGVPGREPSALSPPLASCECSECS